MNIFLFLPAGVVWLSLTALASAEVKVATGYSAMGSGFTFQTVPSPANNDAATAARFILLDGVRDQNGGSLDVLHDGQLPSMDDQPLKNFFFNAGTDGGRIQVDLGRTIHVKRIGTYSWHSGARGPQVYALFAADGKAAGFYPGPKRGVDPTRCGWTFIANVDTRTKDNAGGGQYAVAITADKGVIGSFRYLLFEISPTERRDPFGNTFYSEIDVLDAEGPEPTSDKSLVSPIQKAFDAENGTYLFVIDVTDAPDLALWTEQTLKPVIQTWYPKLVALLASDGYQAPTDILLRFRSDMGGTPASAGGSVVNLNAVWFRKEMAREALGAVIHELVHLVQNYGRAKRTNPNPLSTPGWVVEGIADYIRWFLYEPQSRGAEISRINLAKARFEDSYRTSANFLNWVTRTYDKDLVPTLNAAAREGRYADALWIEWTGKSVQQLGADWKQFLGQRLNGD